MTAQAFAAMAQGANQGAQFVNALVGSDSSTSGSGSGSSKSTSTIDLTSLVEALTTVQENAKQSEETQDTQALLGDKSLEALQTQIAELLSKANDPTAFADEQKAAVANVLDSGIANVIGQGTKAGAYDSSVVGQAGQKLTSRAINEGVATKLSAENALMNSIAQLFNVEKGATATGTTTKDSNLQSSTSGRTSTTTDSTQKQKSSSSSKSKQKGTQSTGGLLDGLGGKVGGFLGGIGGAFGF